MVANHAADNKMQKNRIIPQNMRFFHNFHQGRKIWGLFQLVLIPKIEMTIYLEHSAASSKRLFSSDVLIIQEI